MAKIIAQLICTDQEGRGHVLTGDAAALAKRLKTLRCEAKLTLPNGDVIGECTRLEGLNPTRTVRWTWSYNSTAVGKPSKDPLPRQRKYDHGDTPCSSCRESHHRRCYKHLKDGTPCSCSCPIASNNRTKKIRD
jgi:hypothetical protein